MELWGPLEADLLHFYNIESPLSVRWHKLLRLIGYLPPESSIFLRILSDRQIEYTETGEAVRKDRSNTRKAREMLRQQHKRDRRPRTKMSLDEFLKDNPNTGAIK